MATQESVKRQVPQIKPVEDIGTLIKKSVVELGKALPSHMSAERIVRIALTTLRLNPKLYRCTPESFLAALFQSAQLGLEPNIEGQAYIIPFDNSKKRNGEWITVTEAQFQIGYKGYAELFYRHEKSLSLDMQVVKANDTFDYAYGTDNFLKHKPAASDRGPVIGYYAIAKLANGATMFRYMPVEDCMEHGKKFSKCFDKKENDFYAYTPWRTNPDAMCMKTVLIQLMKLLPKSIEIQRALAMDETVKTALKPDMIDVPDEAVWADNGKTTAIEAPKAPAKPETAPAAEPAADEVKAAELSDYLRSSKSGAELSKRVNQVAGEVAKFSPAVLDWFNTEVESIRERLK